MREVGILLPRCGGLCDAYAAARRRAAVILLFLCVVFVLFMLLELSPATPLPTAPWSATRQSTDTAGGSQSLKSLLRFAEFFAANNRKHHSDLSLADTPSLPHATVVSLDITVNDATATRFRPTLQRQKAAKHKNVLPSITIVQDASRRNTTGWCALEWAEAAITLWNVSDGTYATSGCEKRQTVRCTKRMGNALVLYMLPRELTTAEDGPLLHEVENLKYFFEYGVMAENASTAVFDAVDYVFLRMRPEHLGGHVADVRVFLQRGNVRFVWVPDGPCDLCAHARVISSLFGGVTGLRRRYVYVVAANAGVRGPFQHEEDAEWIDAFAMAGQSRLTLLGGPNIHGFGAHPVSAVHVSTQIRFHPQSFFVGFPQSAYDVMYRAYAIGCRHDKEYCIRAAEVGLGDELLTHGIPVYSFAKNITIRNHLDVAAYKLAFREWSLLMPPNITFHTVVTSTKTQQAAIVSFDKPRPPENPCVWESDVCSSMFAKYGGTYKRLLPVTVKSSIVNLTRLQSPKRRLSSFSHSDFFTHVASLWGDKGVDFALR